MRGSEVTRCLKSAGAVLGKRGIHMGNRALENRVKELKAIEEQQKALTERAEKIKEEIKKDMQAKGKDEIKVGNFVIRFKEVITKRFDTKALQNSINGCMRLLRSHRVQCVFQYRKKMPLPEPESLTGAKTRQ